MGGFIETIFTGKFSGTVTMVMISAAIVFLLRALYGPKGIWRDPKWDAGDRRRPSRRAEERERLLEERTTEEGRQDDGERSDER